MPPHFPLEILFFTIGRVSGDESQGQVEEMVGYLSKKGEPVHISVYTI